MNKSIKSASFLEVLKGLGVFTYSDAVRVGIAKETLRKLIQEGAINKLVREGYYLHPEIYLDPEEEDFAVACAKFGPKAAIGSLTALFHYGLIEQVPSRIWVLAPPEKTTTLTIYRLIRTKLDPSIGIVNHPHYRIASIERAIAEAFYHEKKTGLEVATMAIKTALREQKTDLSRILTVADALGIGKKLDAYLPVIITGGR